MPQLLEVPRFAQDEGISRVRVWRSRASRRRRGFACLNYLRSRASRRTRGFIELFMARAPIRPVEIRQLTPADAEEYVRVRREALVATPFAFIASPEDDRASSVEFMRTSLAAPDQATFGAFAPTLVGIVGVGRERYRKAAHKAQVWGTYVQAEARGLGIGRKLMEQVVTYARTMPGVTHVHLCVSETAPDAANLYRSLGFRTWGEDSAGISIDGVVKAEEYMVLVL